MGIVADDLTGAADSVAPFAGLGLRAIVWLSPGSGTPPECDALALVSGTRDAGHSAEERDAAVRRAARILLEHAPRILYQKIDSTLRGDVTGEMAAFRAEIPGRAALVCPAFPANGRSVSGGRLYVHGEPWRETAYAPPSLRDDRLIRILCPDPVSGCAYISLEEVRGGAETLRERLRTLLEEGCHTLACDADSDADLETLTRAVLPDADRYLLVGSGGWTGGIARLTGSRQRHIPLPASFASGRALVVIGSRHTASRSQARLLCERLALEPVALLAHHANREAAREALHRFESGSRVVVAQSPEEDFADARRPAVTEFAAALRQSAETGERGFDAVIVTGGDTAMQFCRGLQVRGLSVTGEVAPGVVAARTIAEPAKDPAFDDLPLILKSGGFGATDLLASCVGGTDL